MTGLFTPPPGQTLLIVGQDLGTISSYVDEVRDDPGGVTTYTDISEYNHQELLWGLRNLVDWGSGEVNAAKLADLQPDAAMAIGVYLVDHSGTNLAHIADGTHDDAIDDLGAFITELDRPVYVRLGYEFDGEWNRYDPEQYIAAWQHVVDRWRATGVDNFAAVWQSATWPLGSYQGRPFGDWYPGDEYVDWMATSWFVFDQGIHDEFLDFAREHGKPVMIAEAAPRGYDIGELTYGDPLQLTPDLAPVTAEQIWDRWYAPFVAYVHENADVVRAVGYINADWDAQLMWRVSAGNGYWGDSRVQANEVILDRWLNEIGQPFWLHGSSDLSELLGWAG
ncbi:MAG: hypothetical protein GY722_12560 [bacterium]|nr:hypothetical protein [bacterium]